MEEERSGELTIQNCLFTYWLF